MTEEMFMRLLDLVAQAGEGGFVLAILYLLVPYFKTLLFSATFVCLAIIITRTVRGSMRTINTLRTISCELGLGDWYDCLSAREAAQILTRFYRLKERAENNAGAQSPSAK